MIAVTYVGHATVRLELDGTTLLTDPVLRRRVAHLRRIAPPPAREAVRGPDAVLVSHAHLDHLDRRSLRLLGRCPVVAPRGCAGALARAGVRDIRPLAAGEALRVGTVEVRALAAAHDGRRHPLSRQRETLAYVVSGAGGTAFFAGDTGVFADMAHLAGGLDLALLPVWGWGARVGPGHMDPERAALAASLLAPLVAIPIHWGTLAAPRVPWRDDPGGPARAFAREAAARAPGVEVRALWPGGRTEVDGVRGRGAAASSRRTPRR
mgnify:CR=1 FL=1